MSPGRQDGPDEWTAFGLSLDKYRSNPVWRLHCDAIHQSWLRERPVLPRSGAVLKTDLFDEAVGEGVRGPLQEMGTQSYGVDISLPVARAASQQGGVCAAGADVRSLPFRDSCFDAVISISTLDHFHSEADIRRSILEIHRTLRPDGRFLATLDNPRNPVVALRNALPPPLRARTGLAPYFTGKTLPLTAFCELLEECGFTVEHRTTLLHCPRVLAIPLARLCGGRTRGFPARLLGAALRGFERLRFSPLAERTGHFVAVKAIRSA